MKEPKPQYKLRHIVSSILMIVSLVWLTVSTPFVYAAMQEKQEVAKQIGIEDTEEECPLSNPTEEKAGSSINTLSEYLHDTHTHDHTFEIKQVYFKCHPSDLYFAYHPEMISPPPEAMVI